MFVFGVVATKGGVGKTTVAANLGGLLADIGYRVLLIDADVQPSLSRYFALAHDADHGLTRMVMAGSLTPDCISQIELPPASLPGEHALLNAQGGFLHLVKSDTRDGKLQDWLSNRLPVALDHALLAADLNQAVADLLKADVHQLDAMRAALATNPKITSEALRGTQASSAMPVAPSNPEQAPAVEMTRMQVQTVAPASTTTLAQEATATPISTGMQTQQSPLPGMLASVPAKRPPETTALLKSSQLDGPDSFEQLGLTIVSTLKALNTDDLPMFDVLVSTPHAPFGFIADLPELDLAHADRMKLKPEVVELRAAVWRVLAAVSGQCDQRVGMRYVNDPDSQWGQLLARGRDAFVAACEQRVGLRLHEGGDFTLDMGDISRVLSDPSTGYVFIKLFTHMEQMRLHLPERFPAGYVPLFAAEAGDDAN